MKCYSVCANNIDNECTRHKIHLLQAECADRIIYIKCRGKVYVSRKYKSECIDKTRSDDYNVD